MRLLLVVALAIGVLIIPTSRAVACSCAMTGPAEAAEWSDAVFAGHVVGERRIAADAFHGDTVYTFAVEGVAKGNVGARIDVVAGGDGAMCGMAFGREQRWLVFASLDEGVLHSGLCSGSIVLEPGQAAPLELVEPAAATEEADAQIPIPLVVVLATGAFVLVASWLAFRRTGAR
ncbi:MAG: hypothetical protein K5924_01455 [Chloroflexi bacterium]|nr:hypothetical protein [Chloroflexota bacterium]